MDHISHKFLKRLPKKRKLVGELRQAAAVILDAIEALEKGETISLGGGELLDPLHNEETMGKCLLDAGTMLGFDAKVMNAIRTCSESRMGIHECEKLMGGRCLLRELITEEQLECYVPSGYQGHVGELWYGRILPPIRPVKYHVFLTTPYILLNFGKDDWTAYLNKSLLELKVPVKTRLAHFMKHGREPNQWNEFIFQAYHHHQFDAIFLAGLPDVPGSLPHGSSD